MLRSRPLLGFLPRLIHNGLESKWQGVSADVLKRNPIFSSYPIKSFQCCSRSMSTEQPPSGGGGSEPWIPEYEVKKDETIDERRSRLMYQSRKRGILENGLLLSTFANKHLKSMTEEELVLYDRLINLPSNDWDIYYWATGARPTPEEFDNPIMAKLKEHTRNSDRESRFSLPPLH